MDGWMLWTLTCMSKKRTTENSRTNFGIQDQTSSVGCLLLALAFTCIHVFFSLNLCNMAAVTKKKEGGCFGFQSYRFHLNLFEGGFIRYNEVLIMEGVKQQELVPFSATTHQRTGLQRRSRMLMWPAWTICLKTLFMQLICLCLMLVVSYLFMSPFSVYLFNHKRNELWLLSANCFQWTMPTGFLDFWISNRCDDSFNTSVIVDGGLKRCEGKQRWVYHDVASDVGDLQGQRQHVELTHHLQDQFGIRPRQFQQVQQVRRVTATEIICIGIKKKNSRKNHKNRNVKKYFIFRVRRTLLCSLRVYKLLQALLFVAEMRTVKRQTVFRLD